jgi:integrase
VKELTRRDVRQLVERVADRAPVMANNVLALVSKMLNFGVDRDWLDANPAGRMRKPTPTPERDRVLTHEEIRRLWACLGNLPTKEQKPAPGRKRASSTKDNPICPVSRWLAAAMKMRLLTAQRGGEVLRMRWADVDLESRWWTIPAEHSKNGQPHRVPLTADAVQLICSLQPEEERGLFVFSRDGSAAAADRARKAGTELSKVLGFDFRGHDLRRTAATQMAEAGISRSTISHVLNHVDAGPRATRVYDRYGYDAEKRMALEAWERRLRAILANEPRPKNLLSFGR